MTFDFYTFIWTIINFCVLLWLLKRFLYKPVLNAMERREHEVQRRLKDAAEAKAAAAHQREEYESLVKNFEAERSDKLQKVKEEMDNLRDNLMKDVKKEGDFKRNELKKSLDRAKTDAEKAWARNWLQTLAKQTDKVLRSLSDTSLDTALFNTFMNRLTVEPDFGTAFRESGGRITILTSFDLSDTQKNDLKWKLSELFSQEITPDYQKNEEIGIILSCGYYLLRWTIDAMTERLTEEANA